MKSCKEWKLEHGYFRKNTKRPDLSAGARLKFDHGLSREELFSLTRVLLSGVQQSGVSTNTFDTIKFITIIKTVIVMMDID